VIRIATVVTDRKIWTGGYNYFLNLVEVSSALLAADLSFVLFFGDDVDEADVAPFARLPGTQIVRAMAVRHSQRERVFAKSMLWGVDPTIQSLFDAHRIDLALEAAQFFGRRLRQPVIAWMADFQHRLLRNLFTKRAYWRRELGFLAQINSGRAVMLSSEDARHHCERFYPRSRGRTHVVRFAVPTPRRFSPAEIRRIVDHYRLPAHFFFLPNQFWRHKNHECAIRALGILKAAGIEVVVAASGNPLDRGDPDHWHRLQQLIAELGVSSNFRLLGMVPNEHLYALLQGCAALINPSLSEGWSTTVEEAKSSGTPMILSDLRVHREQAAGRAAFFDPKSCDQLADVLRMFVPLDAETRAVMAMEAGIANSAARTRFASAFLDAVESVAVSRRPHT
jgi:glycosyltransferase involved in cell wall biosynthesis